MTAPPKALIDPLKSQQRTDHGRKTDLQHLQNVDRIDAKAQLLSPSKPLSCTASWDSAVLFTTFGCFREICAYLLYQPSLYRHEF